jgi:hypothetical protein
MLAVITQPISCCGLLSHCLIGQDANKLGERMPITGNSLADNLTLEIIRGKVAANTANATINV